MINESSACRSCPNYEDCELTLNPGNARNFNECPHFVDAKGLEAASIAIIGLSRSGDWKYAGCTDGVPVAGVFFGKGKFASTEGIVFSIGSDGLYHMNGQILG